MNGPNSAHPALIQVIKQANSHVGLVFSPDGNTLYAAGGSDDAVYVYTKGQGGFVAAAPIPLGHFPPGTMPGNARNKGLGLSCAYPPIMCVGLMTARVTELWMPPRCR